MDTKIELVNKDNKILKKRCKKVSVDEGLDIGKQLLSTLMGSSPELKGLGLSANQVGIDASVCVIKINDSKIFTLVNPKIVEKWGETTYSEGCLSFPGKQVTTRRYKYVIVEADNYEGQLYFGPQNHADELGLLESICVQHEISHLNGETIFDYEKKLISVKNNKSYGRNEKVTIVKDNVEKLLKYKKVQSYLEDGWKIQE